MIDQAATLRQSMSPRRTLARARVIAIASGKGGVGKTSLTINLAIALAQLDRRVVVLDGDLGLANVDVMLALHPRFTLAHVIAGECSLADAMVPAPGGIWVIPGASGLEDMADLSEERRQRLIRSLAELDDLIDVLLIDTAAGVSREVSAFLEAALETIVVTTPEPTAITDAYALVKVASQAALRDGAVPTFRLVVNQANDVGEANGVARKIQTVAREFLAVELDSLGYVPLDRSVGKAIRGQVPLLLAYPSSPAALRIVDLARRLAPEPAHVKESGSAIITLLKRLASASGGLGRA